MSVGFVGLGVMGRPMAARLVAAGRDVVTWTRSGRGIAGATAAASVADVFRRCDVVILMLADAAAVDGVLGRGTEAFGALVRGRTVVAMGTAAPQYSAGLAADIGAAGGRYVEAPVSGSRGPAENGELVAMVAGDDADLDRVRPVLAPMCRAVVGCGAVPGALLMKLAVNTFLISMVTGLAEAFHFAGEHGLDAGVLEQVLAAGPMASYVSKGKARKIVSGDFGVQAATRDVLYNNRLIVEAARERGIASQLLDVCGELLADAVARGHGERDMVAVIHAMSGTASASSRNGAGSAGAAGPPS